MELAFLTFFSPCFVAKLLVFGDYFASKEKRLFLACKELFDTFSYVNTRRKIYTFSSRIFLAKFKNLKLKLQTGLATAIGLLKNDKFGSDFTLMTQNCSINDFTNQI